MSLIDTLVELRKELSAATARLQGLEALREKLACTGTQDMAILQVGNISFRITEWGNGYRSIVANKELHAAVTHLVDDQIFHAKGAIEGIRHKMGQVAKRITEVTANPKGQP